DVALIDLCPTGDAWSHDVPIGVEGDRGFVALGEVDGFRARANPAHLSCEDVNDLRKFIDAKLAKKGADGSDSRILLFGVAVAVLLAYLHGSQFEDLEDLSAKAHAVLHEEDGASAGELDKDTGEQNDGREDRQHEDGEHEVDEAFGARIGDRR